MGAGALAPGRVCTEFPKDKEFRAFEMLEKIEFSLKPRRCVDKGRLACRSCALVIKQALSVMPNENLAIFASKKLSLKICRKTH
jgi:hypothetical protein